MNAASLCNAIEHEHGLAPGDLKKQTRARAIAWPRQMAMYGIRLKLGWSFPRIARHFRLKDHTTAVYGCRTFEQRKRERRYVRHAFARVMRECA
jgi:chromosomal replication initiator protein